MTRDSVIIYVRCPVCDGRGGFNPRDRIDFTACPRCEDRRVVPCEPQQLTPGQANSLRDLIAEAPPDPDEEYLRADTLRNVQLLLTGFSAASVEIPESSPGEIHLADAAGQVIRILPEFRRGKFHSLNATPLPPGGEP